MIAYCKEGYPNEACGILAGKDNTVSKIYKMTNTENSPVSYFMDSKEQFNVMKDMRQNSLSMIAIFHSHPSSAAYPSAKDVSLAFYDDCAYIIVSLVGSEPELKTFSIINGEVKETEAVIG